MAEEEREYTAPPPPSVRASGGEAVRGELQGCRESSVGSAGQEMRGVQYFTYAEGGTDAGRAGFLSAVVFGQKWYIIIGLTGFPALPATRVSAAGLARQRWGSGTLGHPLGSLAFVCCWVHGWAV